MLKLDVDKIRAEMDKQGLTVHKIARDLDVTPTSIYDTFRRRPITKADLFKRILNLKTAKELIREE